jgi:hypothetical protein
MSSALVGGGTTTNHVVETTIAPSAGKGKAGYPSYRPPSLRNRENRDIGYNI